MNTVLVGLQWGDEGKGKLIDILAADVDCIVRYQGGNNAGHTVVVGGESYVFHLLPSGILHKKKVCVIANGVVVDPAVLLEELALVEKRGVSVSGRIKVSDQAHVIFPYHRILDGLRETKRSHKIGTTGRGIGPCYADKASRCGIRVGDLLNARLLKEKLEDTLKEKNDIFRNVFRHKGFRLDELHEAYSRYGRRLRGFVVDTAIFLNTALRRGESLLFEGAQGTFLDIDFGTYPFVTSSSTTAGGVSVGTGVPPQAIDRVVGVVKAYATRVGEGPFTTEFPAALDEAIRSRGHEFGATTGRPRRCGWFDAVMVRHAAMINGVSSLAVMKLDVLDELDRIKVCVAYKYKGKIFRHFFNDLEAMRRAVPVYREFAGWRASTAWVRDYHKLPARARSYIAALEDLCGSKVSYISVGSDREETLFR